VGGALPPPVAAVRNAVRASVAGLAPGDLVLAACSGGQDSLAVAAALAFVAPRAGLRAGAVTVDHGLQEGSAQRAADLAQTLRGLGLDPVRTATVTVAGPGGPEAAARAARYAALEETAVDVGAVAVLLGHTLDDQAETVLLGLARGSGPRSLAGMPPRRGLFFRPLLGVRRSVTAAACAALGLPAWSDPHNADRRFARVRVRLDALPALESALGPGVAEALVRTADQLRDDAEVLEEIASSERRRADAPMSAASLAVLPGALRSRVLRSAALEAGCPAGALTAAHVARIEELVTDWHGQRGVDLPGGVRAARQSGEVLFERALTVNDIVNSLCMRVTGRDYQMDAADMGQALKEVLITQEQLGKRTAELAAQIDADYAGRELLLVGVLKGAVMVMADLARAMHLPVQMDWMAVSSYGSGTKSSGVVRILKDLDADISGRHVLIVEDIIDSGLTLSWLVSNLKSRDPASVAIAAMLRKPNSVQMDVEVAYTGFEIPDEFVVGYGLDYAERYRNLPFIGTLAPEVYGGNTSR
jgi:hypoxanthine phosphoribosyltransferase